MRRLAGLLVVLSILLGPTPSPSLWSVAYFAAAANVSSVTDDDERPDAVMKFLLNE